jgi:dienelactone hydrolase
MEFECRRCHRPVKINAQQFEVFERMHYVCFHYEFEHGKFDVDEECAAGGCPSASLAGGRDQVIETARNLALEAATGAAWTNMELHQYLDAFAAWLADSDGYYLNRQTVPPGNGWEVVNDALKAATVYE